MGFRSIFAALAAATLALAIPAQRSTLDVWTPTIIYPTEGVTFYAGDKCTITWDVSDAPAQITNPIGAVFLRKGEETTPLILEGQFLLTRGAITVDIPWVDNGTDYSFVLFGDSGNFSPTFSITGPSPFVPMRG